MEQPTTATEPWYYYKGTTLRKFWLTDIVVSLLWEPIIGPCIDNVLWLFTQSRGSHMPQVVRITPHVAGGNIKQALEEAFTSDMAQKDHDPACIGVHCQAHRVFFPTGRPFCQLKTFYKTSKIPGTRFCKLCIEQAQKFEDLGVVMEYQL